MWPTDAQSLAAAQRELAGADPGPWSAPGGSLRIGGCWVCFPADSPVAAARGPGVGRRPGHDWGAGRRPAGRHRRDGGAVRSGAAGPEDRPADGARRARYGDPSGRAAARRHRSRPPPGAGLALHLGAVLGMPTVGVTHRPLLAHGEWPDDRRGATSLLRLDDTVVGCWMRTPARGPPAGRAPRLAGRPGDGGRGGRGAPRCDGVRPSPCAARAIWPVGHATPPRTRVAASAMTRATGPAAGLTGVTLLVAALGARLRTALPMTGRFERDAGVMVSMPVRCIRSTPVHASDSASIASRSRTA